MKKGANKFIKMTGNRFLPDTSIITAWLKGESKIADKIYNAEEINIPIIVPGELYYGALYSTQKQKNLNNIKSITSHYNVLQIDEATTVAYENIKTALREKGKPIPQNDIWIAAIAQRFNFIVGSRDKHFKEIVDINLKSW